MIHRRAHAPLTALGLLAILAGCGGSQAGGGAQPLAKATVAKTDLSIAITETGSLKSAKPATVTAREGGKVLSVVKEGEQVKTGDKVLELESTDLANRLETQLIELDEKERNVAKARSELRLFELDSGKQLADAERTLRFAKLAREQYVEGKAKLRRQELDLAAKRAAIERDQAVENAQRMPDLLDKGFVTSAELRTARLDADEKTAQAARKARELEIFEIYEDPQELAKVDADVAGAEVGLARVKEQLATQRAQKEGDVRAAEALLARHKAQIAETRGRLASLVLIAPADGLVVYGDPNRRRWYSNTSLEVGSEVQRNQVVMQIPDFTDMVVEVGINQIHVDKVKPGQPVTITVDGLGGQVFRGVVEQISATVAEGDWREDTKRYPTTIKLIDAAGARFRPGMEARVEIQIATLSQVAAAPISAVVTREGKSWAWVERGGGRERRQIEIGQSTTDMVEIRSGLAPGDTVLVFAVEPGDQAEPPR